jgi:apolipoprotein N-acyltransferase
MSEITAATETQAARSEPGKHAGTGVAALAASATMLYFGTGLHPIWWLTWFAIIPVLVVAPRLKTATAFGVAALAFFAGGFNVWHYAHAYIEIPAGAILVILAMPALMFGVVALAFRAFVRRGALGMAVVIVPALWVTAEYLSEITSPNSTFGNLGYTQMNFLPLIQIASLTGIWGISFCLVLFSAAAAAILSGRGAGARKIKIAAAVAVFLAAVVVYGAWRLHATPAASASVEVGIIGTGTEHEFPHDPGSSMELLQSYATRIEAAPRDVRVFVLPEKIALVSDEGTKEVDALFEATAAHVHATIIAGIDRGTRTRRLNEARVYSPNGSVTTYVKHHLVPRLESVDQPGTGRTLINAPSGVRGVEICKDMDFPHLSREYGEDRVGLLFVPAWDFVIDGWLHGRMAILRGVEDGFTIVRSAKEGRLTVSDSRGRVLAEENNETGGFQTLFAAAPELHVNTLYARWGNWFAWLNIVLVVALLFAGFREKAS